MPGASGSAAGKWRAAPAKAAQGIAALLLAALFVTFLLQIFSRYALNAALPWTLELCLTLWVWLVFWGCAFVARHRDHVRFDVFYNAAPPRLRRLFALSGAAAITAGFAAALHPTWDFIDFLKIKKSATLRIPMRAVFSIYMVFLAAAAAAYFWRFIRLLLGGAAEEDYAAPAANGADAP